MSTKTAADRHSSRFARSRTLTARISTSAAAAAIAVGAVLGASACSAGQISQTANQAAAVNGNEANIGSLALRDVHIVYPEAGESAFAGGGPFELAFLISNNSSEHADSLTSIKVKSGKGTVSIEGGKEIGATDSLRAGKPAGLLTTSAKPSASAAESADSDTRIAATVTGASEAKPGLTVPMVFTFARAGEVTVEVPVDTGAERERQTSQTQNPLPWPGAEEGGH